MAQPGARRRSRARRASEPQIPASTWSPFAWAAARILLTVLGRLHPRVEFHVVDAATRQRHAMPTHATFICMKLTFLALLPIVPLIAASPAPPVRGLHLMAPAPEDLPLALRLIKEALPKEGVNVLILEVDDRYQFTKRPEVADSGGLSAENVKALASACKEAGVRLIPQINLLGRS